MKTITLLAIAAALSLGAAASPQPVAAGSKCISVQPICAPGTRPVCACESDISLNCAWICISISK